VARKRAELSPTVSPAPAEAAVAERLLSTASDLFYREGVQAVGVQRLIEEAGIAKASLYAHFASKDHVVAAYIERQGQALRDQIEREVVATDLDARGKLLRIFDLSVARVENPKFRGCPIQNVTCELADAKHPAKAASCSFRQWLRGLVDGLVREAGYASPEIVSGALLVLADGATATALVDSNPTAARHARWAAEQLLDAAARTNRETGRVKRETSKTRK
jgi:AcrR family transcriptional regulator